ncbi:hypothetical protein CPB86DRAFT_415301 [Serendipita vermifera]|nr:hypothetical protein CPB86DRAFT_415301 [Serendipita vermifera]
MAAQLKAPGIPITMPSERKFIRKHPSDLNVRQASSLVPSAAASPRPSAKTLLPPNKNPHAQVVLLKRKRNEEPLDGLLLEYNSRPPSDLDLTNLTIDDGPDQDDDASVKGSIRARKKKKLATSRGFFQLAETVEKAKWDDEAWRRDFNERVLAKSKEGKRALAAAAGVEINLDSPVIEKTQPQATHSPSPPVRESFRPTRKYTAVLQARPSLYVILRSIPQLLLTCRVNRVDSPSHTRDKGKEGALEDTTKTHIRNEPSITSSVVGDTGENSVVYFDAVPVRSVSRDERDAREENEIAAFLPMLQDYLKLHDEPPKVVPDKTVVKAAGKPQSSVARDSSSASLSNSASDDEYVYDVYFKGNTEPTSSDWNNLGNYGTLVGLPLQSLEDSDYSDGLEGDSDYEEDDDSNG